MSDLLDGTFPEVLVLKEEMHHALSKFFSDLRDAGDDLYFHPHPFTNDAAKRIVGYSGRDLYYVLCIGKVIVAYGMLRGWDDGFEIPSLGIAVARAWRGRGVGNAMMHFLHVAARVRGSTMVRLKVHQDNHAAINMYKSLGYDFRLSEGDFLVGYLDL